MYPSYVSDNIDDEQSSSYAEIEIDKDTNNESASAFEHSKLDEKAVLGMVFQTAEDAEQFYSSYALVMGFDVRRSSVKKNKKGILKNREWECSFAGLRRPRDSSKPRIRKETKSNRCDCPAFFRIAHDIATDNYKVTTFVASHNHALADPETTHRLKGHRFISEYQKATIDLLQQSGVRTCQSIRYLEQLDGGGPGSFAARKKDFYNYLNKQRVDTIRAGDVQTALSVLEGMQIADPNLVVERTCDSNQTLSRLFWCDSFCQQSFDKFNDVLIVDSTYKTNTYRYPLVFLSGIDNHFKSTVFGSALLYNETVESYVWLFKTFLQTMGGKAPVVIVTDQDDAMRAAIKIVFPHAIHRLCGWHLQRNCTQNVKVRAFCNKFGKLMMKRCSVGEFEESWATITEEDGVAQHSWVKEVYEKREIWAEAYFHGHFMAMTRTTQRAESLNAVFKQFGKSGSTITEFLRHYFDVIREMRIGFKERQGDAERDPAHVQSNAPLYVIQRHMATIYTPGVMKLIEKEIIHEKNLIVSEKHIVEQTGAVRFVFEKYGIGKRRKWSVIVDIKKGKFECDCHMLEADGLPCRHVFSALKNLNIHELPPSCVRDRWTTVHGSVLKQHCKPPNNTTEPETRRFVQLSKECEDLCRKASQTQAATEFSMKRIRRTTAGIPLDGTVESVSNNMGGRNGGNETHAPDNLSQNTTRVLDPKRITSRGAPRAQPQNCGLCGEPGHKSTTCEKKKGEKKQQTRKSGTNAKLEKENVSMTTKDHGDGASVSMEI